MTDNFRKPGTEGELAADTEYARRDRQIVALQGEIERAIVRTESDIEAAAARGDTARERSLTIEVSELTLRLHQLRAKREGVFAKAAPNSVEEMEQFGARRRMMANAFATGRGNRDVRSDTTREQHDEHRGAPEIDDPLGLHTVYL